MVNIIIKKKARTISDASIQKHSSAWLTGAEKGASDLKKKVDKADDKKATMLTLIFLGKVLGTTGCLKMPLTALTKKSRASLLLLSANERSWLSDTPESCAQLKAAPFEGICRPSSCKTFSSLSLERVSESTYLRQN